MNLLQRVLHLQQDLTTEGDDLANLLSSLPSSDVEGLEDWLDALRQTVSELKTADSMHADLAVGGRNGSDTSVIEDAETTTVATLLAPDAPTDAEGRQAETFIELGLRSFFRVFEQDVLELLAEHPEGSVGEEGGGLFWSGGKKAPKVEAWPAFVNGYKMSCLREYVLQLAALKARVSGLDLSRAALSEALDRFESVPGVIDAIREAVANRRNISPQEDGEKTATSRIQKKAQLLLVGAGTELQLHPELFDKDSDKGHVEFVAAAAAVRCHVYGITPTESELDHQL